MMKTNNIVVIRHCPFTEKRRYEAIGHFSNFLELPTDGAQYAVLINSPIFEEMRRDSLENVNSNKCCDKCCIKEDIYKTIKTLEDTK